MKKSEMISLVLERSAEFAPKDNSSKGIATAVVEMLEALGMQPPPKPGGATAKIKRRCQWESED